ncbi:NUDIX hydrolase [Halomarina rubra]|uniref:NUDIX hydrolase n=1 Tax=Halomarina rubra TaxID=2071873 RepID=A0ABD6AR07_9EURY|nr:NUDIX hydrolase [Halomarina rubra]
MDEWPVVDSRVEYENPYFAVRRERVEQADGTTGDFYHLDMPDDVAVLALTDEGSLVLVEQYRPRLRDSFLELPSGGTNDEDPLVAARRELREETGYRAGTVDHLGSCFLTAWQRNRLHVVVARDLEPGDSELHSGETDITVHHRSVEETFAYVRSTPPVAWLAVPLLLAREHDVL